MNLPEQRSDEDLATSLSMGDRSASATLAQRFAPGIYDFAIRVTLDPAAAQQATENALNRLTAEIDSRPGGLGFHAWLYGIARDEALESMRQRVRTPGSRDEPPAGALAPMDARFVETNGSYATDAAAWAWSSARGQRPRDYSILDLLLRRKITPEEVADIASLSRNGVYGVIGRLRGGFEESFISAALYASGRRNCNDLTTQIGSSPSLGPSLRREISRHAETCVNCRATKDSLPAAADVFATLHNVEIPDGLADRLLPLMLAAMPEVASVPQPVASAEEEHNGQAPPIDEDDNNDGATVISSAGAIAAAAGLAAAALPDDADIQEVEAIGEKPAFDEGEPDEAAQSALSDDDATEVVQRGLFQEQAADLDVQPPFEAEPAAPLAGAELETAFGPSSDVIEEEPEAEEPAALLPDLEDEARTLDSAAFEAAAETRYIPPMTTEAASEDEFEIQDEPIDEVAEADGFVAEATVLGASAPGVIGAASAAETYDERDIDESDTAEERYQSEYTAPAEETAIAGSPPPQDSGKESAEGVPAAIFTRPAPGGRLTAPSAAGAGVAVTAGAAGLQRRREALQGGGDGSGEPPRGPFARAKPYDGGEGKRKYVVYAAALAATAIALYVGIAVGDSLQAGGGGSDVPASNLPTRAAGITEVPCPGPINVNQGSKVSLMFNDAPDGYALDANPGIRPISPTSAVPQVEAISQQGNSILFTANTVPNSAGRTDEYRLTATFAKGSDRQQMECTVKVIGPAGSPVVPTATQPAATATNTAVPATATRAPVIQPTTVPPTVIPTETPVPATPTSSVPTVVPTAGGVLISPTEVPPTATQAPTSTSTPNP